MNLQDKIKKIDDYLNYESFLSKMGLLLISLGIFLTTISFWLGIHVLMFVPAFVLALFIYSLLDIYLNSRKLVFFWQKIFGKIYLNLYWEKEIQDSYFKIFYKNENNKIECLKIDNDLSIKIPGNQFNLYVIIQGKLNIFRKVIKLPQRIEADAKEKSNYETPILQDTYLHIRPYKEGDNLSRIDPIQTVKRNEIYIRELILDIIRKPKQKKTKFDLKIFLRSNFNLKKRTDLNWGLILEWILINVGILASFLEWENFAFLIISFVGIFLNYYLNTILKIPLYTRRQMNFWMLVVFGIFITESVITKDIIESGIHFLILVCILKHRFERERRDAFTYIFLILFVFVALSFFTLKIWFMLFFIAYLITAIGLFSVYSGGEKKEEYEQDFGRPKTKSSYLKMTISILLITIGLFFILPHGTKLQARNSRFFPKGADIAKTGFSEEVNLNMILSIKKDFSKQFILENAEIERIPFYQNLYWTGMRFDYFTNLHWKKNHTDEIPYFPPPIRAQKKEKWTLQYYPNDNRTVFIPIVPLNISGDRFSQLGNDRYLVRFQQKILKATNIHIEFYQDENTGQILNLPTTKKLTPTKISADTLKIMEKFFAKIPDDIKSDPKKIALFIRDEAGFKYSLDNPASSLESFLYDEKRGHCEYFATVLALTLQYLGYPATMVNGFHGGEYQELTKSWIVRGEHAHSWVEILEESGTWLILDPTPDSGENSFWFKNINVIKELITYYDYIEYKWYEYIVQFDVNRQRNLWNFFFKISPYILLISFLLFLSFKLKVILQTVIIPYYRLKPKYKFLNWLGKKSKHSNFILENLEHNFPKLVTETRKIIYGQNETDKKALKKLKDTWNKALKDHN